jgi:hypothetical protein
MSTDATFFIEYKDELAKALNESQTIVDLLTNTVGTDLTITDLIDDQILKYDILPDIAAMDKNYITIETRISSVDNKSNKILGITITLHIFVPSNSMKLPSAFACKGNRLDRLKQEIIKLFNNKIVDKVGYGKIQLLPNAPYLPNKGYNGFELNFKTLETNT